MIPWPIALLTLFYGCLAAMSAATAWRVMTGASEQSLVWAVGWLALSAGAMCGLPLLRPWARTLAIAGLAGFSLVLLAHAAGLVMAGRPLVGLGATMTASMPVLVIRYLRRPTVRACFQPQKVPGTS